MIGAKFAAQRFAQRIDDPGGIDPTARPDLVDHRIAVDQAAREGSGVRDFVHKVE